MNSSARSSYTVETSAYTSTDRKPAPAMEFSAWKRWSEPQAPAWKATFNGVPPGSLHPRLPALFLEPVLPAAGRLELLARDLLERPHHLGADLAPDGEARLPVVLARVGGGVGVLRRRLLDLVDEVGHGELVLHEAEVAHARPDDALGVALLHVAVHAHLPGELPHRRGGLRLPEAPEGFDHRRHGLRVV